MESISKLRRDELFTLALHLDLPDLLNFCKVKRMYQKKLCNNADLWRAKIIRDFPNFKRETLSSELQNKSPQELYVLLYTLKVWKLKKTVDELYFQKQLFLNSDQIISIPENLHLPNLEVLYLHSNRIINIPENLHLPNLKVLALNNNQITSIPENLNLPNLQVLFLNNNRITSIPENLNLPNLQVLYLDSNRITSIPENLNLPNLQGLYLVDNQITSIPENLNLPNLQKLYLRHNPIKSITEFKNNHPEIQIRR